VLFHTPEFFFLLIATLVLFYFFPPLRLWGLALADAVFYAAAGPGYFILFVIISWVTYLLARYVDHPRLGRPLFLAAILINIGNLVFFKYTHFFLSNLALLLPLAIPTEIIPEYVLPIGISFYTFQLIAYIVDVRKKTLSPINSFLQFWVFISFFGQLIAGPIMRGQDFLPQIVETKRFRFNEGLFRYGCYLIVLGLLKKIVLADNIANWVDPLFAGAASLNAAQAWKAAYLFGFQIYFDFSAYSDMAVGLGALFGYRLTMNFATPYLSKSPTEFWRRWNITLSSWIRDYIYIPLGGSRVRTKPRLYFNLAAGMLISGLWHGAMWTFVIWGAIHAALLVMHKMYMDFRKRWLPGWLTELPTYRWLSIFLTLQVMMLPWVYFRAQSVDDAWAMTQTMLDPSRWHRADFWGQRYWFLIIGGFYLLHILEAGLKNHETAIGRWWHQVPSPLRGAAYVFVALFIAAFLQGGNNDFIYFKF
jgi:alginate O-acetyltransferase complex protein AlgI